MLLHRSLPLLRFIFVPEYRELYHSFHFRKSLNNFRPRLRYFDDNGVRIPYLAPADLIYLKQGSWRDKDKLDVAAMREIIARETQPPRSL